MQLPMLCVDRMWYLNENNNIVCSSGTSLISKGKASQPSHVEGLFQLNCCSSQCSWGSGVSVEFMGWWGGRTSLPRLELLTGWVTHGQAVTSPTSHCSRTEPGKNDSSRRLQGFQGYQCWVVISQINSSGLLLAPIDEAESSLLLCHHSELNSPTFTSGHLLV